MYRRRLMDKIEVGHEFPGIGFHEVKNRICYGRSKKENIWKAVLKLGSGKVGAEK